MPDPFKHFRNVDNSIDLVGFYQATYNTDNAGFAYLQTVMEIQPIVSRQVAATAIATAVHLDTSD